jgi:hypothetical protein
MSQQPDLSQLDRIVEAEQRRCAGDPNIIGVGIGPKERGGEQVPGVAIRYAVRTKLQSDQEIQSLHSKPVPAEVEGFVTDVYVPVLTRPDAAPTGERGGRKDDPLVGGSSTTVLSSWHSFPTGYGTLGGICFDAATGDAMAISNAHVWGEDTGRDVIQPWMPVSEYLEAGVKLLACGPVISYLVDWTAPSPLTGGLAAGAAAVGIAAIASDVEDPSRWGQRVMPPPASALTSAETIRIQADLPEHPLPGFPYSAKTRWDFTRLTNLGDFSASTAEQRDNEHVLLWKKVWTHRQQYRGGERVQICAEIGTDRPSRPEDYFVVAQCFPVGDRERLVPRILVPGRCKEGPPEDVVCLDFSRDKVAPPEQAPKFPVSQGIFRFSGTGLAVVTPVSTDNGPANDFALQIPATGLVADFAPASRAEVNVSHTATPITALAIDPIGRIVDQATTGSEQKHLFHLKLEAPHIAAVRLTGGSGEGQLHGICIDRSQNKPPRPPEGRQLTHHYQGLIDLDVRERPDRWAVILAVQTANNVPPGTDPATAAQTIGGLPVSANVAHLGGCILVMSLDHLFDVI